MYFMDRYTGQTDISINILSKQADILDRYEFCLYSPSSYTHTHTPPHTHFGENVLKNRKSCVITEVGCCISATLESEDG